MSECVLTVATGTVDAAGIRQESWLGRTYTVVPVVAIVEGVLHGANSAEPEYAPASVFGQFPDSWNGRPVVMNHPQVNGAFVSANIPEVLEAYQFGFTFNSKLDGDKLKTEAWLDEARIAELGGEFQETLDRANSGELIEVSVGAYIDVLKRSGKHKNKAYGAQWGHVAPDHLAFLSKGTPGACSIQDGCGAPRINSAETGIRRVKPMSDSCCDSCASGGECMSEANANGDVADQNSSGGELSANADATGSVKPDPVSGEAIPPADADEVVLPPTLTRKVRITPTGRVIMDVVGGEANSSAPLNLEANEAEEAGREARFLEERAIATMEAIQEGFRVEGAPDDMVFEDIYQLLSQELAVMCECYYYDLVIYAVTPQQVVYRVYGHDRTKLAINYSITSDGKVTFTGEPAPVNLITKIMPRQTSTSGPSGMSANNERNDAMSGNTGQGQASETQAAPAAAEPKVEVSFETLLASASPEVRATIEDGVRMFNARKTSLVQSLLKVEKNKFTEDQLKGFSIDVLENMAELASVPSYEGRGAAPVEAPGINANSRSLKDTTVAAPSSYLGKKADSSTPAAA